MMLSAIHTRFTIALVLVSRTLARRFMNPINPEDPGIALQYPTTNVTSPARW